MWIFWVTCARKNKNCCRRRHPCILARKGGFSAHLPVVNRLALVQQLSIKREGAFAERVNGACIPYDSKNRLCLIRKHCDGQISNFRAAATKMVRILRNDVLRSAIFSMPPANPLGGAPRPRILLTTTPQEKHGLGLLMSEALMVAEGAGCYSLGPQTPLPDIVDAARALQVDVVTLSFSTSMNTRHVLDALKELRARLPETVALWAGGGNAALRRRTPPFVQVLTLNNVADALADWRHEERGRSAA